MQTTRQTLIQRLQDGDSNAPWEEFSEIYSGYIYNIIRGMNLKHHDAEDLAQKVLLRLWKGVSSFEYDPSRARFRTWLRRVVRNQVLSYLRLQSTKRDAQQLSIDDEDGPGDMLGAEAPEIDKVIDEEWEHFLVNRAMDRLRERFQPQVIEAFELIAAGKTGLEVAEKLDVPRNTVHVYKKRVQKALCREILILEQELD